MAWLSFVLIVASTLISLYAIRKQFQFISTYVKLLELQIKTSAYAIHAVLLVLQVGANCLICVDHSNASLIFLDCADFLMQLCILQICWQCSDLARPINAKRIQT